MSNQRPDVEPVLCYVEHQWAYFTHAPLGSQWGDDWDDAPYEHNAGDPCDTAYIDGSQQDARIVRIAFDAELDTPASMACGNSQYSVQDINQLKVPWLQSPDYLSTRYAIMAGTYLSVFKQMIQRAGGRVYVEESALRGEDGGV